MYITFNSFQYEAVNIDHILNGQSFIQNFDKICKIEENQIKQTTFIFWWEKPGSVWNELTSNNLGFLCKGNI